MAKKRAVNKKNTPSRKGRLVIPVLAGLVVIGVLLASGGFAYAASQESHDPFCGSCHTQPESTFLARESGSQPADLASYHTTKKTLCIDCHSGPGIAGRIGAELLGAHNALAWYTGTAVQPAKLTTPIGDGNCLKCHEEVTGSKFLQNKAGGQFRGEGEEEGGNGHWHELLARWQAADPKAANCVTCHSGHSTNFDVQKFLNRQHTIDTCQACHNVLGEH